MLNINKSLVCKKDKLMNVIEGLTVIQQILTFLNYFDYLQFWTEIFLDKRFVFIFFFTFIIATEDIYNLKSYNLLTTFLFERYLYCDMNQYEFRYFLAFISESWIFSRWYS